MSLKPGLVLVLLGAVQGFTSRPRLRTGDKLRALQDCTVSIPTGTDVTALVVEARKPKAEQDQDAITSIEQISDEEFDAFYQANCGALSKRQLASAEVSCDLANLDDCSVSLTDVSNTVITTAVIAISAAVVLVVAILGAPAIIAAAMG